MTDSRAVLKSALTLMRRALKDRGFAVKGTTFYRRGDGGNTITVAVQRSRSSSPAESRVTINFGVYSARLGLRLQDDPSSSLDVWQAHWQERIRENGREKWLPVKSTDSADDVYRTLLGLVEGVLPVLLAHSTDEALRDEWLTGASPGLGDMQRLLFASILVDEIGPAERLPDVVKELRSEVAGTIHERIVEQHLASAGISLK